MKIRLRHWRQRRAMSQKELAQATGLSEHTISRIEKRHTTPYPGTIRKFAEALNISIDDLLEEPEGESKDLLKAS